MVNSINKKIENISWLLLYVMFIFYNLPQIFLELICVVHRTHISNCYILERFCTFIFFSQPSFLLLYFSHNSFCFPSKSLINPLCLILWVFRLLFQRFIFSENVPNCVSVVSSFLICLESFLGVQVHGCHATLFRCACTWIPRYTM